MFLQKNLAWKRFCMSCDSVCVVLPGVAVLGIALIAMGEDIGADMAYRTFGHLVSMLLSDRIYGSLMD